MSVQLIVYPQSFDGTFNSMFSSSTELLVNGINFNGLNNTGAYTGTLNSGITEALTNAPPTVVNTWYRYINTVTVGNPAMPIENLNNLVLNSIATTNLEFSVAGVYQKLTNLTIGANYTVTINFNPYTSSILSFRTFNGTTPSYSTQYFTSPGETTTTFTFPAASTNDTISLQNVSQLAETITIQNISVQPVNNPINSGAIQILGNGQVICDLYEDEDIPLSLSVDDFKNVAEKVQSYSKAFNLPATKRNNKIFNQIFDITRSADGIIFNPYKKTECVLKQDGFILFKGYLQMLDVTDKEGEISYNVNLYSEVLALADLLKDRTFRDLDFTELSHVYDKTNIKRSWNDSPDPSLAYTNPSTSGFRDAYTTLRYPFVNWNNQWILAGNGGAPTPNNPQLASLEQVFRPFINIKYIIDRIFEATDFTYESSFFNEADFLKLYMDFNWGNSNIPSSTNVSTFNPQWAKQILGVTNPSVIAGTTFTNLELYNTSNSTVPPNYDLATNIITATDDGEQYIIVGTYRIENTSLSATQTVDCQWIHNSLVVAQDTLIISPSSFQDFNFIFNVILASGDTLQAQFKRSNPFSASTVRMFESGITPTSSVFFNVNTLAITNDIFLQTLRGELGQWEFLKGIITMFNLVTLPDEDNPNNIKIEPYADIFINNDNAPLNWTEKIDVSQIKLNPLAELNKMTMFKFVEDDDDSAFIQYKNQVDGHLYGSLKYEAGNEFNILEGKKEIIAEPFAATVVKPLNDNFPQFVTPAIYSYNPQDGTSEGFENSPRIMYNNGIKPTGASFYIPPQNGLSSENQTNFLQFTHLSQIPSVGGINSTTLDFNFGICQLISGVGDPTPNNLFNLYWLPYFGELYNPNTRTMTIKVNLSPADINTFSFTSTVMIKNRIFRVNKIDYKPNDLATVEFILIP